MNQRFDRIEAQVSQHGRDIRDLKKDCRLMHKALDNIQGAVTKHLGWHLRRGA